MTNTADLEQRLSTEALEACFAAMRNGHTFHAGKLLEEEVAEQIVRDHLSSLTRELEEARKALRFALQFTENEYEMRGPDADKNYNPSAGDTILVITSVLALLSTAPLSEDVGQGDK